MPVLSRTPSRRGTLLRAPWEGFLEGGDVERRRTSIRSRTPLALFRLELRCGRSTTDRIGTGRLGPDFTMWIGAGEAR